MRPHILVATTDDEPGVLNRVASLIRRRAFNIHSLTVSPDTTPGTSRMTLVVETDDAGARRVQAHLEKLVNVIRVENLTTQPMVLRDLALIRVLATSAERVEVIQLAQAFRAEVSDVSDDAMVLECTGSPSKIDALLAVLRPYGVTELGRTGVVAMARGYALTPSLSTSSNLLEALSA